MDPCQRRKPPEAVAKGQRLQGSIAPQKSAAEIGGVAASHLLLPRIFSHQAGKPPDKRGFSPPATRCQGWFHDFTAEQFMDILQSSGYKLSRRGVWHHQLLTRWERVIQKRGRSG